MATVKGKPIKRTKKSRRSKELHVQHNPIRPPIMRELKLLVHLLPQ